MRPLFTHRISGALTVAALLTLGAAGSASAATYCVSNAGMGPPSCPLGADTSKTFAQAIAAAQLTTSTADTIQLAPGTYTDQTGHDFSFDSGNGGAPNPTNDLTIKGAGTALTTVAQGAAHASSNVITFSQPTAAADQDVDDLTISMPPGFSADGLFDPTDVHRVNLIAKGAMSGTALRMANRGTFDHMDIELPLTGGAAALEQPGVSVTVSDSTITADRITTNFNASEDVLRNLRLHCDSGGLVMTLSNTGATNAATIDNVQILMDGSGTAIGATSTSGTARLNVTNVTLFGKNVLGSTGIAATTTAANPTTVNVANSIVVDFADPFAAFPAAGAATVNAANSIMFPNAFYVGGPSGAVNIDSSVLITRPHLLSQGGLLYPLYPSPAIDLGDPLKTNVTTDLLGQPRTVDGNGDGDALPDAGAIEYQHRPPTVTATAATPFAINSPIAFQGTASDPDPGDQVAATWSFSDGATAAALSPLHAFSAGGPFTATLTATDSSGLTGQAQVAGTIATAKSATTTGDTVRPVVTAARFDPRTFRASRSAGTATIAAAKTKRPPIGSRLRFTLSEPASASIVIETRRRGRMTRTGTTRVCKARSKANTTGKACTYYAPRSKLKRVHLTAGADAIAFSGRITGRPLAPGAYRATVAPTDAAGNAGAAVSAMFTISR